GSTGIVVEGTDSDAHLRLLGVREGSTGFRRPCGSGVFRGQPTAGEFEITAWAQRLIRHGIAVDGDLVAIEDELPVEESAVEHGLATAPADRLELFERVGDLEQASRAGERLGPEVRADSIAPYRHRGVGGGAHERSHWSRGG